MLSAAPALLSYKSLFSKSFPLKKQERLFCLPGGYRGLQPLRPQLVSIFSINYRIMYLKMRSCIKTVLFKKNVTRKAFFRIQVHTKF